MLTVDARKVTVDHLVLDASQASDGPWLSENDGVTAFAESTTFTNNTVTCPPDGVCALIAGGIGAVVSDNHFQALGPFTGIQLQTNGAAGEIRIEDRKSTRLNSSHTVISYAVFCLKKKKNKNKSKKRHK